MQQLGQVVSQQPALRRWGRVGGMLREGQLRAEAEEPAAERGPWGVGQGAVDDLTLKHKVNVLILVSRGQ